MYRKERTVLAQFCLSILPIVEEGRYRQKCIIDKTCPFCTNGVEDEFHFLFNYTMHNQERQIGKTFVNSRQNSDS